MTQTALYWTCQSAGWTLLFGGTAALLVASGAVEDPVRVASWAAGSVAIAVGATHAVRGVALRLHWLRLPGGPLVLRLAAAVGVAAVASQVASDAFAAALSAGFGPTDSAASPAGVVHISGLPLYALLYGGWVFVYVALVTRFRLAQAERERLRLRASLAEARLEAIERRLDPHLLFNALNTVRALIREAPDEARRAVTMLSDLLRGSLSAEGPTHTVEAEARLVRSALGIEALRFSERLTVCVRIAPDALEAQVPIFLVQTLAENAVKHGVARRRAGVTVCVDVSMAEGEVVVRVENPLGDAAAAEAVGTGTGLASTRERLALLYGPAATFSLTCAEGRAVACARFPAVPPVPTHA